MPKMTAPMMYELLGSVKPKASSATRLSFMLWRYGAF
jgi:hypothetical protein